jgi:hypothetical protein
MGAVELASKAATTHLVGMNMKMVEETQTAGITA